jgi:hypothetical protein
LLRGACHRAALRADPLARNDDVEAVARDASPKVVLGESLAFARRSPGRSPATRRRASCDSPEGLFPAATAIGACAALRNIRDCGPTPPRGIFVVLAVSAGPRLCCPCNSRVRFNPCRSPLLHAPLFSHTPA